MELVLSVSQLVVRNIFLLVSITGRWQQLSVLVLVWYFFYLTISIQEEGLAILFRLFWQLTATPSLFRSWLRVILRLSISVQFLAFSGHSWIHYWRWPCSMWFFLLCLGMIFRTMRYICWLVLCLILSLTRLRQCVFSQLVAMPIWLRRYIYLSIFSH